MKTNVLMKIAVVFMAAFGAYAFNGNNASNQMTFKRSDNCQDVKVGCTITGNYFCKVKLLENGNVVDVWDLNCAKVIYHNDESAIPEQPES